MGSKRITILNGRKYECDDYREAIAPFVPQLLEIIPAGSDEDKLIQEKFLSRLQHIDNTIRANACFRSEYTFFDAVFDSVENNESAQALLNFINDCIGTVKGSGKDKKVREIVKDMVVNFEQKNNTSRFYSRVGELAGLRKILRISVLKLIDIETKLSNGKSVDVVINDGKIDIFCDFVSINIDLQKAESNDDMYRFIRMRIAKKFQEKFEGLGKEFRGRTAIIPIVWCSDLKGLKQYQIALEQFISDYKNQVFHFYGLVYIKEKRRYYFESISSYFQKMDQADKLQASSV